VQGDGRDKAQYLSDICAQLGAEPSKSIYIGDWGQDMRAARDAGLMPIGIARSLQTHEALRKNGAIHVVDHLSNLAGSIV
jgi:phosphoglycolate phosphatase-like HAD superfamily hydrolase